MGCIQARIVCLRKSNGVIRAGWGKAGQPVGRICNRQHTREMPIYQSVGLNPTELVGDSLKDLTSTLDDYGRIGGWIRGVILTGVRTESPSDASHSIYRENQLVLGLQSLT